MSNILFVESMDIEFSHIMESFENDIAYLNAKLLEESDDRFFYEATQKGDGGLIGFVKKILDAIIKMLSDAMKKIKSFLTGAELNDEFKERKMIANRDPRLTEKFMNGYIPDAKSFLNKCMKGEVSVEEARGFVVKNKTNFEAIGQFTGTVSSLFGISSLHETYINKWKRELDEVYTSSANTLNAAKKMAKTQSYVGKKSVIKETTSMVLNQMSTLTGESVKGFEKIVRDLYAKNYVKQALKKESDALGNPSKMRALKKEMNKKHKDAKKAAKEIYAYRKRVQDNSFKQQDIRNRRLKDNAERNRALNRTFLDSNKYVDRDELAGKGIKKTPKGRFKNS